jgi:putative transposase
MPWRIQTLMSLRHEVVELYLSETFPVETLLESFGISRRTLFYWVDRYRTLGVGGLVDRSRRPHHLARSHSSALRERVLAAKQAHRTWGPRKLRDLLQRTEPNTAWPAPSTIGTWLAQAGMVTHRRRRGPRQPVRSSRTPADAPNAVWTIDFKGQFATRDGQLCYPLTVQDAYSRYLLSCQALAHPTWVATRAVVHRCFHQYGVPQCLRSDNGPPFASPQSLGRLSRLQVWWIKLGIRPELIRPATPSENGRHERMHRTLKADTAVPPARTLAAQQHRFTAFRTEYNHERPHEALGSQVPADCYVPSSRRYRLDPAMLAYPAHWQTRRVQRSGTIKWQGQRIFLSEVLSGEPVGLEETAPESWLVYFGPHPLGHFTAPECHLHPLGG